MRFAHRIRDNSGEPLAQPPYGYVKSPENPKKWIIEPEAAKVVQEIYRIYLEGKGTDTIARILEERGILNCTAYWKSKGIGRGGKKTQPNPYKWKNTFLGAVHKFMEIGTLTAPLLQELIDQIDVYVTEGTGKSRTQRIVIDYRFVGYIELPDSTLTRDDRYRADSRQGVAVEYIPKLA